jgi:hypothetical protein
LRLNRQGAERQKQKWGEAFHVGGNCIPRR